ncbi:hypothetical protein BC828DRAFT_372842 [Blastocladiella britannica]|nr:hypothetical protein BC828DRAFT_372842 [Blastocladiella britannica]
MEVQMPFSTKNRIAMHTQQHYPRQLDDLPQDVLSEILVYSSNCHLVCVSRAVHGCLHPARLTPSIDRARYLLNVARVRLQEKTAASSSRQGGIPILPVLAANVAGQLPGLRRKLKRAAAAAAAEEQAHTAWTSLTRAECAARALNVGVRMRLLDTNLLRHLDRYADGQLVRLTTTRKRTLPRWLAARLGIDPGALPLLRALLDRGMTADTGFAVLSAAKAGQVEVLRKLRALGFPLDTKDGLAVLLAVEENHDGTALQFLLDSGIVPPPAALDTAVRRALSPALDVLDSNNGMSGSSSDRKRRKLEKVAPACPVPPPVCLSSTCHVLVAAGTRVEDSAVTMAITAYPSLPLTDIRVLLDAMRRRGVRPGDTCFDTAARNKPHANALIELLIQYGGAPPLKLARAAILGK